MGKIASFLNSVGGEVALSSSRGQLLRRLSNERESTAGYGGYLHVQVAPATTWVVNHNLGAPFPSCFVYDASGSAIDAEIIYVSVNQIRIYFVLPTAGHARVN